MAFSKKEANKDAEDKRRGIECGLCLAVVVVIGAIAIPNLIKARKGGNETAPIGALKTIGAAQALFRESDKEGDGNLDYGTLSELATAGTTGLIDRVLGSGTKNGYLFECTYGALTSEFIWIATATPTIPGTTGERYFVTNHEGVTCYTTAAPFVLNSVTCEIPPGSTPVGR